MVLEWYRDVTPKHTDGQTDKRTELLQLMGCLLNPANVQQTSSKCIQNTRANARRLLEVCWTFAAICYNRAGRLLDRVNTV